ncbi:hypothetical protein GJ496_002277 [Pomphorhynchus laevis]|nr:hypothetical protein GJ496_002277 [Pomphorhynchus laevis]
MKRRIERWNSDNWSELIAEARYLQSTRKSRECIQAQIDWKVAFRRSIQKGDTKAAIKSLEDASGGSYLNPDDFIGSSTVRQLLESKHPEGDRVYVEGVMTCPHPNLLPFHLVMSPYLNADITFCFDCYHFAIDFHILIGGKATQPERLSPQSMKIQSIQPRIVGERNKT